MTSLNKNIHAAKERLRSRNFRSNDYWERRYSAGGNSGAGSYGATAQFKAEYLNRIVAERAVRSVVEFGSGDGHQLSLAKYPVYTGLDVSKTAIATCASKYCDDGSKSFIWYAPEGFHNNGAIVADLTLSLDVIYHLVEDDIYELHMRHLFATSQRLVAIFAPNWDERVSLHVRYREFTSWVQSSLSEWTLVDHSANPLVGEEDTAADFYLFSKESD